MWMICVCYPDFKVEMLNPLGRRDSAAGDTHNTTTPIIYLEQQQT